VIVAAAAALILLCLVALFIYMGYGAISALLQESVHPRRDATLVVAALIVIFILLVYTLPR